MTDRWAEQSIDPALFSQELMANASGLVVDEEVLATQSVNLDWLFHIPSLSCTEQVVFATSPQEHYFDCPYQLSSEKIGQTYQDAMVILLSSILLDSFSEFILSIVAKILGNLASNHSKDPNFDSPYSMEARSR
ncbi:hypothetical protein B296_00030260, partial [Ensete ventricosum]